jgi:hypothetical protein
MIISTDNALASFVINKKKFFIRKGEKIKIEKCDIVDILIKNNILIEVYESKKVKTKKIK